MLKPFQTFNDVFAITSSNAASHRVWKDASGKLNIGPSSLPSAFVQDLSGNVGIGTTSPSSRLTIESSTPTSGDATLNIRTTPGNITAGSTIIGNIYFSTQDASSGGTGDVARIAVIAGDGSSAYTGAGRPADLAFYTQPLGAEATLVESMRIDQNGNVVIGTTSPGYKLDVNGTARISATVKMLNGGSYNENIRMSPSSNDYSSLVFGADPATDTGTRAGQWTLVRYPAALDNKFSIRHNSADAIAIDTLGNTTFFGNIAVSGTVDGVDIAALNTTVSEKANIASPTLTGTPAAPTAAAGTNTTQLATTAFVQTAVSNLVDAAPGTLDTLNELAAALGDDPSFATTVSTNIGTKVAKAGDTMSGTLTINNSDSSALSATSSGDRTAGFTAASVNNLTTSSTNNITKTGLRVSSLNAWSGTNTTNRALFLQATGATTNRAIEVESGTSVLQDMTATTAAFSGNILLTGPVTTTNQARTIDFTGFDKEGTTDFSDRAYIQHTINTGGHAGSVLVISSQNDADDGIAFLTNASSQIRHNGHVMWDAGNDGATSGLDADLLDGQHASDFALSAHTHGNITNAGAIGTTASLPIITTTSGVLTTGSFGTTAGTFAQGNDSRLSDARTPLSHTHGNITNAGAIGTTADLVAVTTTSGVLTTASRSGIDSRTAFPTTYANITGTVPTWNQSTTGNAATATNAEYANIAGYATDADIANSATIATTLATARTLTIGNTGKTFNGSANVSWTLSEIGATNNTGTVIGPSTTTSGNLVDWNSTDGTIVGTGRAVVDSTVNAAIGTGTGIPTERDVYYGLSTINASSQTRATNIYAPTTTGSLAAEVPRWAVNGAPLSWRTIEYRRALSSTITSTTTTMASTGLTFTAVSTKYYRLRFNGTWYGTATTTGIALGLSTSNTTGTPTLRGYGIASDDTVASTLFDGANSYMATIHRNITTATTTVDVISPNNATSTIVHNFIMFDIILYAGTSDKTITLNFARYGATGTLNLILGSTLTVTEII
jgi:hypothetical protein